MPADSRRRAEIPAHTERGRVLRAALDRVAAIEAVEGAESPEERADALKTLRRTIAADRAALTRIYHEEI